MREREAALAARWRAGEFVGRWLRVATGEELLVLFAGRPGGPAGPDFRDAVLARTDGAQLYGDVEVHVRARGWQAHGHADDPRYDGVVLHVVLRAEGAHATPLASGAWAALVELEAELVSPPRPSAAGSWPCAGLTRRIRSGGMRSLLHTAGDARFAQRVQIFASRIAVAEAESLAARSGGARRANLVERCGNGDAAGEEPYSTHWSPLDRMLFVALAEGLAYGREREPLRRAGEWLAGGGAPDALLRALPRWRALDGTRLEGLLALYARWELSGPWAPLSAALEQGTPTDGGRRLAAALAVPGGSVSPGRAAILAANVVLPCAAAWALARDDAELAARAQAVYAALPGLPSNQITREMVRQLGLGRQPSGARAQQGLHHIWSQHCHEKRCAACPCARQQGAGGAC
jgi:Protein of unknown function (DUF2851)